MDTRNTRQQFRRKASASGTFPVSMLQEELPRHVRLAAQFGGAGTHVHEQTKSLSRKSTCACLETGARNLSSDSESGPMRSIPRLPLLRSKRSEHLDEVPKSAKGHHDRYESEGGACYQQTHRPKPLPTAHCTAFPAAGFNVPAMLLLAGVTKSEPPTNPTAANPKATNPVVFSDQCRKKKGTIAPTAPISIAR